MCAANVARKEPVFDAGPDGFPRPGQVIRYFRQVNLKVDGRPWTQRDLAQALGKQELAVREMELRDAGMDDILRRRFLSELFAIPPHFLGLSVIPESQWWTKQGFPLFDTGPDGFPRPGQIIRYFRQAKLKADGKPWTQHDLAQVLGKQELAVREMELRDTGLNAITRRRVLAYLFAIPPGLLGLAATPHADSTKKIASVSKGQVGSEHLKQVRDRLTGFWTQNESTSQEIVLMLDTIVRHLYERYPTIASHERLEVVAALCELHIHAANLLRDSGKFTRSLHHLNQTKELARLLEEEELLVDVLYRCGGVYLEKGEMFSALKQYHTAEQMLTTVSAPLQAAVLLETALCEAKVAPSKQQCSAILKKLDRAGHIIRGEHTEAGREKWPYLKVDGERYHLDRAATLIVLGNPEEAQQELKLLSFSQLKSRRSIYHLILQAQAYFGLKEYAQAALLAEEALPLVRSMHSRVNLERVKTLYKQLQDTSFRNNPEIGRLGYLLFPV